MPIISSSEYPQVRSVLDVSLNDSSLPDEIISQDIYHGRAERDVTKIYADAATFTGDNLAHVKLAVILFTAAYLAPAIVRITSTTVTGRDASWSKQTFDPEDRANELREQGLQELEEVGEDVEVEISPSTPPTVINVANQGRGKYL